MSVLKRPFGGGEPRDPDAIWLYVRCDKCGQKLKIRVDKHFNPRADYEHSGVKLGKEKTDDTWLGVALHSIGRTANQMQSQLLHSLRRRIRPVLYHVPLRKWVGPPRTSR